MAPPILLGNPEVAGSNPAPDTLFFSTLFLEVVGSPGGSPGMGEHPPLASEAASEWH